MACPCALDAGRYVVDRQNLLFVTRTRAHWVLRFTPVRVRHTSARGGCREASWRASAKLANSWMSNSRDVGNDRSALSARIEPIARPSGSLGNCEVYPTQGTEPRSYV